MMLKSRPENSSIGIKLGVYATPFTRFYPSLTLSVCNQFEELVNEFIPSDMSWRGWIKMAFHQPLVPVLPVARELLAKTRWTASKTTQAHDSPLMLLHPQIFSIDDDRRLTRMQTDVGKRAEGSKSGWRNALRTNKDPPSFTSLPLTAEPEPIESEPRQSGTSNVDNPLGRKRVKSLFSNKNLRQSPNTRESDKVSL